MTLCNIALIWALIADGQITGRTEAGHENEASLESARRVRDLAGRYEFFVGPDRSEKLELLPKPVLTYSNPIRGEVYGDLFVWTWRGRPAVIGAIFDFRNESGLDSELHTLARGGMIGRRDGRDFWNPLVPGVEFGPVPGAPAPASTAAERSRQLRALAKGFSVDRNHPEQGHGGLRMFPQPVHRYESPDENVLDGAIYVFAEATDPEAILLLEAAGGEQPSWQFAFARMNVVPFEATYDGEVVWRVGNVSWDTVFDKQEPYAIVREKPQRGLKRTR